MKTLHTPILLAFCLVTPAFAGQPVDRVVVYGDRAQITRIAEVRCQGDTARAVFFPLPLGLDERTVRAEASGRAAAVGTTLSLQPLEADRDARVRAAQAAVDGANATVRTLELARDRATGQRARAERYEPYVQRVLWEGMRSPKPDLRTWTEALDTLHARRLAAEQARLKAEVALRAARRERDRLAAHPTLLGPQNERQARQVEVAVACGGEAATTVRLAYVVPGATWQPEYDLRFTPANASKTGPGEAEWVVSALITQSSGEDWENAQIVLSSARPWLGVQAPDPAPIEVYAQKVGKEKVLVQAQEKRETLAVGGKQAAPRTAEGATLADGGTAVTLTLPRRITVHSDSRPYWVPVDAIKVPATARLVAMPGHTPFVYSVVSLTNPAGYPLLAGRLHTYRRGAYMGDGDLQHAGPGAPLEISLGVDSELRVERGPRKAIDRSASLLSSTRHLERAYEIVLKNGGTTAVEVEVREQIPVSKNAALKVELVSKGTTPGFVRDAERGLLTWPVKIAQGAESKVEFAYTVHLPEDWQVQN